MNKIIFAIVGVLIIAGLGYFLMGDQSFKNNTEEALLSVSPEALVSTSMTAEVSPTESMTEISPVASNSENNTQVKEFVVKGDDFSFDVKEIKIKQGEKVRIVFKNVAGFHDWKIDEFNSATNKLQAGQQDSVEFVADKKGTFEYYCSVGSHRAKGMKGNLIVE